MMYNLSTLSFRDITGFKIVASVCHQLTFDKIITVGAFLIAMQALDGCNHPIHAHCYASHCHVGLGLNVIIPSVLVAVFLIATWAMEGTYSSHLYSSLCRSLLCGPCIECNHPICTRHCVSHCYVGLVWNVIISSVLNIAVLIAMQALD